MNTLQIVSNDIAPPRPNHESAEPSPAGEHPWTLSLGAADIIPDRVDRPRCPPPFSFEGGEPA